MLQVVPEIDMDALTAYAREKKVGLILWVVWKTLDDQLEPALDRSQKWGVKGIKVDFMQRDDQPMVNFYDRVTREAAKRKLLVDFHGGQPTGADDAHLAEPDQRRGRARARAEQVERARAPRARRHAPLHAHVPGADGLHARRDDERDQADFAPIFDRPMSQGTRCHQLAMYVVFESPLQMLADRPSNYAREPEAWRSCRPCRPRGTRRACSTRRIARLRRRGAPQRRDWYVGAMTDWTPRDLEVDLSFLPEGKSRSRAGRTAPTRTGAARTHAEARRR